jgi:hypothetical protein
MDDLMSDRHPGNSELDRRLEAYADARLTPDPAAMARIRAGLVADAGRYVAPIIPIMRESRHRSRSRRLAMSFLAASLGLALMAGAVAGARPGGPLYPIRVWVETATLPVEPAARAQAELDFLDSRLDEVAMAAAAGDPAALSAALDAYRTGLESAIGSGDPEAARADLEAVLARHLSVLGELADRVPESARGGIAQAIERGSRAIDQLGSHGRPDQGDPQEPGVTGPATPKPDKTPPGTSEPTPASAETPDPKPDKTPPGRSSPKPAKTPPGG